MENINWAQKIYLVISSIRCLFICWRTDAKACYQLISELNYSFMNLGRYEFLDVLLNKLLIPNFRLKASVHLGRPSVAAHRKFSKLILMLDSNGSMNRKQELIPHYLLIRNGAMGDVLMLTPFVRALYESHNGAILIDIATSYGAVFNNNPCVNRLLTPHDLSSGVRTYDVVLDLNGTYERAPMVHPVNAYGIVYFGHFNYKKQLELHPDFEDITIIDKVVREIDGPFIVVHQFVHAWPNRTISEQVWNKITESLVIKCGLKVVYIGTNQDFAPTNDEWHQDHRGRYTLQQLSALIARSKGFIGGDSGPSHVAGTTNVPMAVFYTCAHHKVRMPLRDNGRFLPIIPSIECYGCLTRKTSPLLSYVCVRGDNACVNFDGDVNLVGNVLGFFDE